MLNMLTDILPQLKHVGFSLLLRFRLHSSRSGRFCMNLLQSFGVFPVLKVAPLWVSVLHLHTSLSACKRDMSLPIPLPRLRNGDIPNPMLKSLWINHCMEHYFFYILMQNPRDFTWFIFIGTSQWPYSGLKCNSGSGC